MNKRFLRCILSMALVLTLSGCSGASEPKSPVTNESPAQNTVEIKDFQFNPATISIRKGESVTWVNKDRAIHTATGSNFDSGSLPQGTSFSHVFIAAGTYDYLCTPHPWMKGKVVVQ